MSAKTGTKRSISGEVDYKSNKKPKFDKDTNSSKKSYQNGSGGKDYTHKNAKDVKPDGDSKETFLNGKSSRDAHREQKSLALQRKAAKPNADIIHRSKKIWERLRRKSHVPKPERTALVKELFEILDGRVKDFVFKHDSVRVVQCAVKYGTKEQKVGIARELKGKYRELAESRYAKFLVGKLVMVDDECRDIVVEEFGGGVKRLIRGSESGWILDDVYRGAATKEQKALLLREWYGPSVGLLDGGEGELATTGDLKVILEQKPELRGPVMQHLKEMCNQLVQMKKTGFTILHDALWQYWSNCVQGGPEEKEVMDWLRDDEEGDLVRNLAFTPNGARLLSMCLAAGDAKYRRGIVGSLKTHVRALAADANGARLLVAVMEVMDDTREVNKTLFKELLAKEMDDELRKHELLAEVNHLVSRIPILWPFNASPPKWLTVEEDLKLVAEVRERRKETSKKDPEKRRAELVEALSQPLFDFITSSATSLIETGYGCQLVAEVLLNGTGNKEDALQAIATLADGSADEILQAPHAGRLLKTLVVGGHFDKATGQIKPIEPPLNFHDRLYSTITAEDPGRIIQWATGPSSFSVLAMLEASGFEHYDALMQLLRSRRSELEVDNVGARKILELVDVQEQAEEIPVKAKSSKKTKKSKS
ncbi:Pumilio homology domain family member 6 [Cyphellophora attinorum]|uniref:Pumilio homology domain family member 6 n=1 Tax=Cyphellophora attinorum TaxID=1664694 RepID=A0A0N1GYG7_9EURO|nr:Pumilio homology domain family member 6 [Phialophora attinorum]KPI35793.1 Pumilio homology domain family member 6 [Phialophora attinorum]